MADLWGRELGVCRRNWRARGQDQVAHALWKQAMDLGLATAAHGPQLIWEHKWLSSRLYWLAEKGCGSQGRGFTYKGIIMVVCVGCL